MTINLLHNGKCPEDDIDGGKRRRRAGADIVLAILAAASISGIWWTATSTWRVRESFAQKKQGHSCLRCGPIVVY